MEGLIYTVWMDNFTVGSLGYSVSALPAVHVHLNTVSRSSAKQSVTMKYNILTTDGELCQTDSFIVH